MIQNILSILPLWGQGGFLYIDWNPDLIALQLGPMQIRWYSLCWLIGLMTAYFVVKKLFEDQKIAYEKFEPLFLYCFIGILLGARLGHCIFYQPDYFLTSTTGFFEMFVPIKLLGNGVGESLASGNWKFIGYEGLASHGGTLGLMIALGIYSRVMKIRLWLLVDFIAIATPITACFIRLGNLMNSEIIGKPTDLPWAFIFHRVDELPRHPGQLYEAIAYAVLFCIMWFIYKKVAAPKPVVDKNKVRTDFSTNSNSSLPVQEGQGRGFLGTGFFMGLCLLYIFTFRILIELTKENQEAFEDGMWLNMGQILSIPFILIGLFFTLKPFIKK